MNLTEKERAYLRNLLEGQNLKTQEVIRKVRSNPTQYIDTVEGLQERIAFTNEIIRKLNAAAEVKTDRFCSISTSHLTRKTWMLLQVLEGETSDLPVYFPKRIAGELYGYIFVVAGWDDDEEAVTAAPEDLKACLRYAESLNCDMLVMDGDCGTVDWLPIYEW